MSDQQSLRDYLAGRRQERQDKRTRRMVLPIVGYEQRLAGRYKILGFDEKRDIQHRHEKIGEAGDGQVLVNASADLIINSCEDLLEVTGVDEAGKPTYVSLGKRWMAPDVAELFGVEVTPQTTAIQALRLVLDPDQVMQHFGRIRAETEAILLEVEEESQGEAQPSVEG